MTAKPEKAMALLDTAQALGPLIASTRDASERDRTLPPDLVRAIVDSGLLRLYVPASLGGFEADPMTYIRVVEALARFDGAVGWCVMNWAAGGASAGRLPRAVAQSIYGPTPDVVIAMAFAPKGQAVPVPGGYRLRGRWPLASGCLQASWLVAGSAVVEGDQPMRRADGSPEIRWMYLPRADCEILDTWTAGGLRGTGSHDFVVDDRFVPEERTFDHPRAIPVEPGPLYRAPVLDVVSFGVCAVALGIARAALDSFIELAGRKVPTNTPGLLRDHESVQARLAQAEGLVRSARALLLETVGSMWDTLCAAEPLSGEQTALKGLAQVNVATSCAEAVEIVYTLAGASSVYTGSTLDRAFRDVHVVTQHGAVSPFQWERAGRYWLGLNPR